MEHDEQELKQLQSAILKLREVRLREPYASLSATDMTEAQYRERSEWLREWSLAFDNMLAAQRAYAEVLAQTH
jgi:uncharacterized protein